MSEDRSPDGGFFAPMTLPRFDRQQIKALADKSFSQNAADIINLLFSTQLDSWAVEFSIGRYPVKLIPIGSRETVAETWHNPVWKFERLAKGIEKAIRQSDDVREMPSDWLMIAARIAVLFGIIGELMKQGRVSIAEPIDVALPCGDFPLQWLPGTQSRWGCPSLRFCVAATTTTAPGSCFTKGKSVPMYLPRQQ